MYFNINLIFSVFLNFLPILIKLYHFSITKRKDHQKKVTDINEINETLEDITTLLEKQHLNNDFISESPAR